MSCNCEHTRELLDLILAETIKNRDLLHKLHEGQKELMSALSDSLTKLNATADTLTTDAAGLAASANAAATGEAAVQQDVTNLLADNSSATQKVASIQAKLDAAMSSLQATSVTIAQTASALKHTDELVNEPGSSNFGEVPQ